MFYGVTTCAITGLPLPQLPEADSQDCNTQWQNSHNHYTGDWSCCWKCVRWWCISYGGTTARRPVAAAKNTKLCHGSHTDQSYCIHVSRHNIPSTYQHKGTKEQATMTQSTYYEGRFGITWVFWGIKNAIKHWHHCSNKSKSLAVRFATGLLLKHACELYVWYSQLMWHSIMPWHKRMWTQ